ncbi:MAG TPA: hypothetical protein VK191_16875 [Symbiobacteriaceae bacterium]|nr:hypothetical protein [Symbiobacteriaceae bacterium]
MAGPAEYRVLRQTHWGEQTVYMVLHLQQSETFHVIDEPVGWPALGLDHPALPRVSVRHEGNGIRQTWLPLLTGDRLTERRTQGGLTGSEIAGALEAVAAALQHLAAHRPEGVPAVVDPDCICRAPSGEWVVDYAMLAHNPEVRRSRQPAGVYAVGLLFFWLVTGEFPRLGRPALTGRFPPLSTTLLLPLVKAINESYPGLPELQQALVACRRAGGFDRLAEYLSRPVTTVRHFGGRRERGAEGSVSSTSADVTPGAASGTRLAETPDTTGSAPSGPKPTLDRPWTAHDPKLATETLVGLAGRPLAAPPPEIPLRDPSWAPAPWQVGDLPRRPAARRIREAEPGLSWVRPALVGTGGAAILLLATLAVVRPWQMPARLPETSPANPAPSADRPMGPSPRQGDAARLSPWAEDRLQKRWSRLQDGAGVPGDVAQPGPGAPGSPVTSPPAALPPLPAAPEPEPGSLDERDRQMGGQPFLIYINGAEVGWAWLIPANGPWISFGTFNNLFHRQLYWVPLPEKRYRLLNSTWSVETADARELQTNQLWLRLTPELQRSLGVSLTQTKEGRMFFQH